MRRHWYALELLGYKFDTINPGSLRARLHLVDNQFVSALGQSAYAHDSSEVAQQPHLDNLWGCWGRCCCHISWCCGHVLRLCCHYILRLRGYHILWLCCYVLWLGCYHVGLSDLQKGMHGGSLVRAWLAAILRTFATGGSKGSSSIHAYRQKTEGVKARHVDSH
jgi:hypothetical protein